GSIEKIFLYYIIYSKLHLLGKKIIYIVLSDIVAFFLFYSYIAYSKFRIFFKLTKIFIYLISL
ncbi:hypothetical protein BP00DRAFT_333571, partial [Aspergillus indologenus CBS 114.80]